MFDKLAPADFLPIMMKYCDWSKYHLLALVYTIFLQLIFLVFPGIIFLSLYLACKIHEIRTKDLGEKPSEFLLFGIILPAFCFRTTFIEERHKREHSIN